MPTPELRIDARTGNYTAYWSENRRTKRKSMGTADRAAAENRFAQWLLIGGHRGEVAPASATGMTVRELWAIYDEKHVQKNAAAPSPIFYCWKNLEQHFGDKLPSEIDQTMADEYGEKRASGAIGKPSGPGTVRKELVALRACLSWHAKPARGRFKLLEPTDVPAYELPPEGPPRDRWLTTAEIKALMAAARALHPNDTRMTRGERFLWLALETAARKQAILGLTWDRVDFETRMIHYAEPGRKQTKKRRVAVPISDALLPALRSRG